MGAPQSTPRPWSGAPLFHSRHFTSLPFRHCSAWTGGSAGFALLNLCWRSLAWICAPQFHSALLHHHQHSPCPLRTPHHALVLSWRFTSFPPEFIILPFKLNFDSPQANFNCNVLDIRSGAKRHWNSIMPIRHAQIIRKYKEILQLLCAVEELCVPAFVGPAEMGDSVNEIETMFDWYHSNHFVGLVFQFHQVSCFTHLPFSLVLLNVAMRTIECWWNTGHYSIIYLLTMNNNLCIIRRAYSYCSCISGESRATPAVFRRNIHKNPASPRVSFGFPHWLGNSPRCFQTSHNHSHGASLPVIRDPS